MSEVFVRKASALAAPDRTAVEAAALAAMDALERAASERAASESASATLVRLGRDELELAGFAAQALVAGEWYQPFLGAPSGTGDRRLRLESRLWEPPLPAVDPAFAIASDVAGEAHRFVCDRFGLVLDARSWRGTLFLNHEDTEAYDRGLRVAASLFCLAGRSVLVHSCGIRYRDQGFLFAGPSGAGKSTLANLSDRYQVLSDETVLLDLAGRPVLHGTPFRGLSSRPHYRCDAAPLAALLFLVQSPAQRPLAPFRRPRRFGGWPAAPSSRPRPRPRASRRSTWSTRPCTRSRRSPWSSPRTTASWISSTRSSSRRPAMPERTGAPRLTIGILAGRESDWLARCLAELAGVQAPKLVVTNHDLAATRRACEDHGAGCSLFAPPGPFSFARQRNRLFEVCRTPWILMLDIDEMIAPAHLKEALELAEQPPDRAFVPRHRFVGREGPLIIDEQPRLLPGDGRFAFEGHVANTIEAEHERGDVLEPANFEIVDRGAVWDPGRVALRQARHAELGRHERARLRAIARAKDPASWCRLGFRQHVMGHDRRAEPYLRAFLRERPAHATAEYLLARVEERTRPQGRNAALARLQALAERGARDYRVYRALTRLHHADRDWSALARAAERALRLYPRSAVFHHQLAVARHALGDREGAERAHDQALLLFPELRPARAFARVLERTTEVPA